MQLIIPIVLIIVSGLLFALHIDPQYKEIKDKQVDRAQYNEALAKTDEIRVFREDINSKYNAIDKRNTQKLKSMLPTHIDNIRLILDVSNVAGPLMTIQDVRINLGGDGKGAEDLVVSDSGIYNSVGFQFTVVTTYDRFKDFLEKLAGSLRVIDVNSVEVITIEGKDDTFRFDVGIQTYWLPKE